MALGNKNVFAENLKYYMEKHGVDRNKLCNDLDFKYMTVSDWINAKTYPRIDKIEILSNYFGIRKSNLVEKNHNDKNGLIDKIITTTKKLTDDRQQTVYTCAEQQLSEQNNTSDAQPIYLVGQTAAGFPLEYNQLNIEQIQTDVPKGADYALTVKGDSMEPVIKDGQIIFYREQPTVENGEIAIVELNGDAVTCKKLYVEEDKVVLKSINTKYDDIIASHDVRIIGKVII